MRRVARRIGISGIIFAFALALAGSTPTAAYDPHVSNMEMVEGGHGCKANIGHMTNVYGYAIAWTDWPRSPYTGINMNCYRSAADVYYPYLQVQYSGWGYFDSLSASTYQTSPVLSEHNMCYAPGHPGYGGCAADGGGMVILY